MQNTLQRGKLVGATVMVLVRLDRLSQNSVGVDKVWITSVWHEIKSIRPCHKSVIESEEGEVVKNIL